ncbi:MAG: LacI family transcriptional regulator [Chloroflexi bacterium]|nr:MAG: LacI family transcriptional regulator [Chloroflexota bacterium]RLT33294.1 MAG: LacI family transcriptional regulator [Chloroflexota bacterium]
MVTIKDVAAHAGVSTATVSYVLNGQGSIPAETQRRVWESVTTLQYHPRHAARAMRGRSHTLGVSIARGYDRLADPTAAEVLAGMADAASQRGLSLLLIPRTDDPAAGCVQVARSGQVDGVVLFDPEHADARLDALVAAGIAHVCIGQVGAVWVTHDVALGMTQAVQHLVHLGHRAIGLIAPDPELVSSDWYVESYMAAMESQGLMVPEGGVLAGGRREADGEAAMAELLALDERITAVIAASDELAYGAMRAIRDAGLVVGRDVSLMGFDDLPPAAYLQPPLTTMRQPRYDMGVAAIGLLEAQVTHATPAQTHLVLAPKLIIRASTGQMVMHDS